MNTSHLIRDGDFPHCQWRPVIGRCNHDTVVPSGRDRYRVCVPRSTNRFCNRASRFLERVADSRNFNAGYRKERFRVETPHATGADYGNLFHRLTFCDTPRTEPSGENHRG